ncbi:DNA cytosine methyltransferase (plasmid) [Paenibacillus thiaminolyticus]|uniref:DNA cytosine methyltransferase n=1 Tax=Paenibacillus thiaminolyticus TaxID=49283 RepID=UPI00232F4D32|nr:DNA cytosine methyltransferase [Paenibacillus thiaminolyticus]WCF11769.1 DNA cytosine methyltransferase [Paenibacillus thiaminolyticus]
MLKGKAYSVGVICGGIGGSTIGYLQEGMNVSFNINKGMKANNIYKDNFPDILLISESVESLSEKEFEQISVENLDILDIYVPARHLQHPIKHQQSFLMHIIRIMIKLNPKVIVFHSAGRNKGKRILIVNELLTLAKGFGYNVHMETLNASNYGIPQEKYWSVLIGVRKDLNIKPVFPEAMERRVTTEEAIGDLLDEQCDVVVNPLRLEMVDSYFKPGCTYSEVKKIIEANDLSALPSLYRRDRWQAPYHPLGNTSARPFHPLINRLLSIDEGKRLQTFPEWFVCHDWKELCSSIPPQLSKLMAESIKEGILNHL